MTTDHVAEDQLELAQCLLEGQWKLLSAARFARRQGNVAVARAMSEQYYATARRIRLLRGEDMPTRDDFRTGGALWQQPTQPPTRRTR